MEAMVAAWQDKQDSFSSEKFFLHVKKFKKFAKTKKGGKNREKLRIKIARLCRKIKNQKEHHYHQITNTLLRDNQTIIMETLNVKGMKFMRFLLFF